MTPKLPDNSLASDDPDLMLLHSEAHSWEALEAIASELDPTVRSWLADPGSLTARLKALTDNDFRVEVEQEGWVDSLPIAARKMFGPVAAPHRFWSRQVRLLGKGKALVAAHTLLPEHSMLSPLAEIVQLKTKPLGEYLFNHPELLRSSIDVTSCGADTWGRRSLFFLFGKPVLVGEFFLPPLLKS